MPLYYPLEVMQLRNDAGLRNVLGATFGRDARTSAGGGPRPHQGWDLFAPVGTSAFAVEDGAVVWTQDAGKSGYGKQLLLEFTLPEREGMCSPGDRTLYAFYAHLSSILVKRGYVRAGQKIAETGVTGNASAKYPHLHFELRTSASKAPGTGLRMRLDPGEAFGYHLYSCGSEQIGGVDVVNLVSVSTGRAAPMRPDGLL